MIDKNKLLSELSHMHRKLIEELEKNSVLDIHMSGRIRQAQEIINLIRDTEND
jgi:hypothetical protein